MTKKAFSLIELLIVIVIVGVVYTLAVGNFQKMKEDKVKLTLSNLKTMMQKNTFIDSVKIVCLDDCDSCEMFVDGEKTQEIKNFLDRSVKVYSYDISIGLMEIDRYDDICFSYTINKRGVGKQVMVEFKDKIYDFSTYLDDTPVYDSQSELIDAKENLVSEVLR